MQIAYFNLRETRRSSKRFTYIVYEFLLVLSTSFAYKQKAGLTPAS
jgi:hypothetical protein